RRRSAGPHPRRRTARARDAGCGRPSAVAAPRGREQCARSASVTARQAWARTAVAVALAAALAALLPACTSTGTTRLVPANEVPDKITASDESEATKRARARMDLASAYFSRGQFTTALDQVKLAIAAD